MSKSIVLPGVYGPNNVSYLLFDQNTIQCVSDFDLTEEDMRAVELLLRIDMRLGKRFSATVQRTNYGQLLTTWSFLLSGDCDWR